MKYLFLIFVLVSSQGALASDSNTLRSYLDQGKKFLVTITDQALVDRINNAATFNSTLIEGGNILTQNSAVSQNWCEFTSRNGFVHVGDQFEITNKNFSERYYSGSNQALFKVSSYFGFNCRKWGYDETNMTLEEIKVIFGSLISIDVSN